MSNLIQGLAFSLFSPLHFDDSDFARRVVSVFCSSPETVRPRRYGAFEPVGPIEDLESIVRLLVNEVGESDGPRAASLILEVSRDCGFQVQWNQTEFPSFAYVGGHVMFSAIAMDPQLLEDFLELIRRLVVLVRPTYGEVRSMAAKGWDAPVNLKVRLPDVPGISIYGPAYIDFFGQSRIETVPAFRISRTDGFYWLEALENVCEGVPDEVRARIREHLGSDAFMADGKWRYTTGNAPDFGLHRN